jgi:DNA-binding MarR family transcriptional regulator
MRTEVLQGLYLPTPKLNQLHILKQIASNPDITQAELAQRCMLSVAMVNNYMKEFCSEGLLEYRRKSSKTISYHLTAAGRSAADSTECDLLRELLIHYAEAKERVRQVILSQAKGNLQRVVLFGRGDLAELAFHALESAGVSVVGVCDDDPAVIGRDWCGREILNASQIRYIDPDSVVVASTGRSEELCRSLSHLEDRGIRLIRLEFAGIGGPRQESSEPSEAPEVLLMSPNKQAV